MHHALGQTAEGALLSNNALTAVHWSHRVGALIVALIVGLLAFMLSSRPDWRKWGLLLGALLVVQIGLGIANILLSLPLPVAIAHNLFATLLLTFTLSINFRLWQKSP